VNKKSNNYNKFTLILERLIMKYYLAILLFIFVGCAAQMAPKGGPVDNQGPKLIKVSHPSNTNITNTNTEIVFYFDEFINPLSIVNSIEIIDFTDFSYQVRGKKIIITPNQKWPKYKVLKINISRNISDFNGNNMDNPIKLSLFSSKLISDNKIFGHIVNSNNEIFNIGLYTLIDSTYILTDKTESNNLGDFKFQYLDRGYYVVAAVNNKIDVLKNDIRNNRYGLISKDFIDLFNQDSTKINIKIGNSLERLSIKSFRQVNNNFGYIMLDNGSEKPFLIPKDKVAGDSLTINIKLNNRFESYLPSPYTTILNNIIDTIPPNIISSYHINSEFYIIFDEPISKGVNAPNIYYKLDTTFNKIDYSFIDSFKLKINNHMSQDLYVANVSDIYLNHILDTIHIQNKFISDDLVQGGNIYGSVEYEGNYPMIVKAESSDLESIYYAYTDSTQKFSFLNIQPGFYTFTSYEVLGDYDSTYYYNGSWAPFKRAAKFGMYPDILEVRSHWDIKDMVILVK
tara:strand:+ start:17037 stop:18572 length:1536 start_codon:yes stop_codon:yes gene_type:complete